MDIRNSGLLIFIKCQLCLSFTGKEATNYSLYPEVIKVGRM